MSKEKQRNQREIEQSIDDFTRNRTPRKSGINKQEWEKIKQIISLTPKQYELYNGIRNNTLTICQGPAGTAKAQPLDSLILTPNGWITMGDIEVGDRVISDDGNSTIVTGVFPQGKKDIWELSFSDGSKVECCSDHLWFVTSEKDRKSKNPKSGSVKTTLEIIESLYTKRGRLNYTIPITSPVNLNERKVEIDPYLFGILLGDGCFREHVELTTSDEEIINYFQNSIEEYEILTNRDLYNYSVTSDIKKNKNKYIKYLKELGLYNLKSDNKFIPNEYKYNSLDNRIKLLRGLMDSDGSIDKDGSIYFGSNSIRLVNDVKELIQSLGGIATDHSPYNPSVKKSEKISYRITVTMNPNINPFSFKRKLDRVIPKTKYKPNRYITSAKLIGKKEAQCIMVDSPSRLYLTNDYIVTHNTFVACYSAIGLLADKKIEKIILTKPIQESGENLGFLPGTIEEKTDPYMQSYFSTFQKILGKQSFEFMKAIGEIVVEPIAYMRGTTYDDSIMLLDEAQNCNMHQLMLWSTRLGKNSKAVMMGDISQYDIKKKDSKFLDFISLVTGEYEFKDDGTESQQNYKNKLSDVYSHKFGVEDIVRNKFLIDLVDRYEKYKFQNGL
jgi:phosphate starvation-inducible protein PhoH